MHSFSRYKALGILLAFGLFPASAFGAQPERQINRLAGKDRYETAAMIAVQNRAQSDVAIVVSGAENNWPDALAAAGLAGFYDAPILTTNPQSLSLSAAKALQNLQVKKVLVIGGTASLSSSLFDTLANSYAVERIGGENRYATAEAVYGYAIAQGFQWGKPLTNKDNGAYYTDFNGWKNPGLKRVAILATGANFPDATSASALAYYAHYPILLTPSVDNLTAKTADILAKGNFDELIVAGDTKAISKATRIKAADLVKPNKSRNWPLNAQLDNKSPQGNWWWETSGASRYETSSLMAQLAIDEGMPTEQIVIATGEKFADAAAGSTLKIPIMLVNHQTNGHATSHFNSYSNEISRVVILGDYSAVYYNTLGLEYSVFPGFEDAGSNGNPKNGLIFSTQEIHDGWSRPFPDDLKQDAHFDKLPSGDDAFIEPVSSTAELNTFAKGHYFGGQLIKTAYGNKGATFFEQYILVILHSTRGSSGYGADTVTSIAKSGKTVTFNVDGFKPYTIYTTDLGESLLVVQIPRSELPSARGIKFVYKFRPYWMQP